MNAAKLNRVVGRIRSKMNRKNKDATKSPILDRGRVNYLLGVVNLLLDLNRPFLCVGEP